MNKIIKVEMRKATSATKEAVRHRFYVRPYYNMCFITKKHSYTIDYKKWILFTAINKSCLRIADIIEDIFYDSAVIIRTPPRFIRINPIGRCVPSFVCGIMGIVAKRK